MSLFDEPLPAHLDDEPVLWFGVIEQEGHPAAIIASKGGFLSFVRFDKVNLSADVRWVQDRAPFREQASGPGWVDLSEMNLPAVEPVPQTLGQLKEQLATELGAKPASSPDYLTTPDGTRWDPVTNRPIDE